MSLRRTLALLTAPAAAVLAFLAACGSDPAADGGECESNDECQSNNCIGGSCAGRPCTCVGPGCPTGECDDGWTCSERGVLPGISCTRRCETGGACPTGTHCSNGLCVSGKEIVTSWVTKPGTNKCRLNAPCRYEARAEGEGVGDIVSWTWTMGDAGPQSGDAAFEYLYPAPGTYPVVVAPKLANGRSGPLLEAVETVCVEDPDFECTPGGNDCCVGTCTLAKRCR